MKTNMVLKATLLLAVVVILSGLMQAVSAQNDPTREILVYFTSGVERVARGQSAVRVVAAAAKAALARHRISEEKITSAFPDFDEADTLKTTPDGRTISLPNMARIFKVLVPGSVPREEVIDSLKKLPSVLFAEPNGRAGVDVVPNDQYFAYQWALQPGGGIGKIQAPEAWDIFQGSSSTKIGIIDVGVDATHPDLNGKVSGSTTIYGYHGTHVAGIAAAKTNNTTGVAGVNWNAQILAEAFNDGTSNGDPYLCQIITDAVNQGCGVLNNSWKLLNDDGTPGRYSTTVRMAFANAYKQNRVAIATIGNTGNTTNTVQYPGSFGQGIIAVGATDQSDAHAYFSTYGSAIDVAAPGVSILSTFRNGVTFSDPNYEYLSGTSMSAPFVSGIASLLKGYNPNLYNDDIEHVIQLSADDITAYPATTGWDQYTGYGRVNARKALDKLRSPNVLTQATAAGGTDLGASSAYWMTIYGASGLSDGWWIVKRHEVQKTVSFSPMKNHSVWGRGAATSGWADNGSSNFSMGWCDAVPGTITGTSATLRTYVYEVYNSIGQFIGWYPTSLSNVTFAYTVLGELNPLSVYITGPSVGPCATGTWYANVSGGVPGYSYQWYQMWSSGGGATAASSTKSGVIHPNLPIDTWWPVGTDSPTLQLYWCGGNGYLRVDVTDAQGTFVSAQYYVQGAGGGGGGQVKMNNGNSEQLSASVLLPESFSIGSYPNPFNPSAVINYQLPVDGTVKLSIFDVLGREVETLVNGEKPAGYYTATFNASRLQSGVYLARISATPNQGKPFVQTIKMLLTK